MLRVLTFCILIAGFAYACSSGAGADANDSAAACKPVNPNGDSELALIMREMADWTDSCKVAIQSGRVCPPPPVKLEYLQTAERTDKTIDAALFNSMASLYQSQVTSFQAAKPEERTDLFNATVSGCVGCHQNFCQGPLTRIEKMYIR